MLVGGLENSVAILAQASFAQTTQARYLARCWQFPWRQSVFFACLIILALSAGAADTNSTGIAGDELGKLDGKSDQGSQSARLSLANFAPLLIPRLFLFGQALTPFLGLVNFKRWSHGQILRTPPASIPSSGVKLKLMLQPSAHFLFVLP